MSSDDNPYSESQFKTLKYRPEFPERFGSIQDARAFCQQFLVCITASTIHSGIALLTQKCSTMGVRKTSSNYGRKFYEGRTPAILTLRSGLSQTQHPPMAAWINPPVLTTASERNAH